MNKHNDNDNNNNNKINKMKLQKYFYYNTPVSYCIRYLISTVPAI